MHDATTIRKLLQPLFPGLTQTQLVLDGKG
jgi:hypothetical protein